MFEWSRGSTLRAMVDGHVPGAAFDDWLESWLFGLLQSRLQWNPPLDVLDVVRGSGTRPHRDAFRERGARVTSIDAERDPGHRASGERYDLITLLSLERAECLRPLDLERPLEFLSLLFDAALLLKPGGTLVWSELYCFSADPDSVHALLEPVGVYQALVRRNFQPLEAGCTGAGRVEIYHCPDTLFVRQEPILALSDRQERVTRICAGVSRRDGPQRVRFLQTDETRQIQPAP